MQSVPDARRDSAQPSAAEEQPSGWDNVHHEFFQQGDEGRYEGGPATIVSPEELTMLLEDDEPRLSRTPEQNARRAWATRFVAAFVGVQAVVLALAAVRSHHRISLAVGEPVAAVLEQEANGLAVDERVLDRAEKVSRWMPSADLDVTVTQVPSASARKPTPRGPDVVVRQLQAAGSRVPPAAKPVTTPVPPVTTSASGSASTSLSATGSVPASAPATPVLASASVPAATFAPTPEAASPTVSESEPLPASRTPPTAVFEPL